MFLNDSYFDPNLVTFRFYCGFFTMYNALLNGQTHPTGEGVVHLINLPEEAPYL